MEPKGEFIKFPTREGFIFVHYTKIRITKTGNETMIWYAYNSYLSIKNEEEIEKLINYLESKQ